MKTLILTLLFFSFSLQASAREGSTGQYLDLANQIQYANENDLAQILSQLDKLYPLISNEEKIEIESSLDMLDQVFGFDDNQKILSIINLYLKYFDYPTTEKPADRYHDAACQYFYHFYESDGEQDLHKTVLESKVKQLRELFQTLHWENKMCTAKKSLTDELNKFESRYLGPSACFDKDGFSIYCEEPTAIKQESKTLSSYGDQIDFQETINGKLYFIQLQATAECQDESIIDLWKEQSREVSQIRQIPEKLQFTKANSSCNIRGTISHHP